MTAFFVPRCACCCVGFLCAPAIAGCALPQQKAAKPPEKTQGETVINPYAKRVKYRTNRDLVFADFTLRYVGQTKVIPALYPHGFLYYNFLVKNGKNEQKVQWSSGTGEIGPLEFTVGGKVFWLELKIADTLGRLADNELVISPAPQKRPPPPLVLAYGQSVAFQQNPVLVSPDFMLGYIGQTKAASKQHPHGVSYHFVVKAPAGDQIIEQSSRTGNDAPLVFSVGKKSFWLEIKAADGSDVLASDALVVSPAPPS